MQINIHDLLNNIEDSSVNLEETNVVSSAKIKELTKMKLNMTTKNSKRNLKKIFTVGVAASLVAALSIGAYAAFGGGLKDVSMKKGEDTGYVVNDNGDVQESTVKFEYISSQGFAGSPEYLAAQEWMDFTDNYDQDGKLLDAVGNKETPWDAEYGEYLVYTQEMADKLDEITAKYNLKLHHNCTLANQEELNAKFGTFMSDATYTGYFYDDGTFQVDGDFGEFDFQLRRDMKGSFSDVFLNIGDRDDYEEWTFTTTSGQSVSLALSKEKALIIADLDNSFVSVNVMLDLEEELEVMTKADLENMANHIDFSIL